MLRNKRFVYYSARTKSFIYCQTVHHIDWCHYSFSIARSSDEANPLQYYTLQIEDASGSYPPLRIIYFYLNRSDMLATLK